MKITRTVWECDICGEKLVFWKPGLTPQQELEAARWTTQTIHGSEVDLCPNCSDEYFKAMRKAERAFLFGCSKRD